MWRREDSVKWNVKVNMTPFNTIIARLGVDAHGDVQAFVTADINKRITRYMPYRSSALATKTKFFVDKRGGTGHLSEDGKRIKSPTEIEVVAPYAHAMYVGKVWVDPKTGKAGFLTANGWMSRPGVKKVMSNRDYNYDKTKNPQAGPYWDRRLIAAEGAAMQQDLQNYVNRRAGR